MNIPRTVLALVLTAVCLAGCATMGFLTSDPAAPYAKTPADCEKESDGSALQNARKRACQMQAAYADAMGRASAFSRDLNLGLFGIGAATAGLAMTGTAGVPLIALALATAAGFTGNELFIPARAHVEIFEVGARASGCMWSLGNDYVAAAGRILELKNARDALSTARDQLASAVDDLNRALARAPTAEQATDEWKAAKQIADGAAGSATEAGTVVSSVSAQIRALEVTTPSELDRALGTIRVAIKKAALSANPDTATVMNAVRAFQADVPAAYTGLVGSRIGKTEKALGAHAEAQTPGRKIGRVTVEATRAKAIEQAAAKVKDKLDALRGALSHVRTVSDMAAVPNAQTRLQECITTAQSAPEQKHVKVNPSAVHIKPGGTEHVAVSGGVGPYRPVAVGVDSSKVSLTMGTPDASTKVADLAIGIPADLTTASRFTVQISDDGSKLQTPNYVEVWVDVPPKETPALSAKPQGRSDNKVGGGVTLSFAISGGTPPYTSGGVKPAGDDVSITVEPAAGTALSADNTLKVTAKPDAPPGNYAVVVKDAADVELLIKFEVTTAASPGRAGSVPLGIATPEDVRTAQELLRRQRLDPGPGDGDLGPRTRNAIERFQQARALTVTRSLDPETRQALGLSGSALTTQVVTSMQGVLRDLGFYKGPLDGIQSPLTIAAIKRFQRTASLDETGVFDKATQELLSKQRH